MEIPKYRVDAKYLKKIFKMRMFIFLVVMILTVIFSAYQPQIMLNVFDGDIVILLTRLWILSSIIATGILTYLGNKEIIGKVTGHHWPDDQEKRDPEIQKRVSRVTNFNHLVIGLVLIFSVLILVWLKGMSNLWISFFAGPVLVSVIMLFDWNIMVLYSRLYEETMKLIAKRNSSTQASTIDHNATLIVDDDEYRKARHVFFKLDIPVYCGLWITFFVGMILLPKIIAPGMDMIEAVTNPYVCGFVSGATALQILVGNITFSIIGALPSQ